MRRYYNAKRPDVIFGVIDGEGQGDGIPRGQLQLVDLNAKPKSRRWFEFVMSEKVTHIKIGTLFEYYKEKVS